MDLNPAQIITGIGIILGISGFMASTYVASMLPPERKIPMGKLLITGGIILAGTGVASAYLIQD